MKKILMVAGDPSAEAYCADIVKRIIETGGFKVYALGGNKMEAAGAVLLCNLVENSTMGFYEVFKKWLWFRKVFKEKVARFLREEKPDMVFVSDFYGFNINVAKTAKTAGIPVIYYIGPKIWAWNAGRVRKLRKFVDRMLVIFPFEEKLYRDAGIPVSFVGNPVMDIPAVKEYLKKGIEEKSPNSDIPVVGLMPGSRKSEKTFP